MKTITQQKIRVFSPASVANVGCGFDVFGFALDYPGDEIRLSLNGGEGVRITRITGQPGLPMAANKNTAGVSLLAMMKALNLKYGIDMEIHKKMPIRSGLGSSSASAVGSVYALDKLLDLGLSKAELLHFAQEGEKIASGNAIHHDNTGACLYGGFILVRNQDPVEIVSIPVPKQMHCVILHPHIEIDTGEARKSLPKHITLKSGVIQWANTAAVVAGLYTANYEILRKAITDSIVEPIRAKKIPFYQEIRNAALENGAAGCGISGSGPAMFTLAENKKHADMLSMRLSLIYREKNIPFDVYVSRINRNGPRVITD